MFPFLLNHSGDEARMLQKKCFKSMNDDILAPQGANSSAAMVFILWIYLFLTSLMTILN